MVNTSLAAATLSNGNRHVFFQEKSGAIRQAIYSRQAVLWQASTNAPLVVDAKNDTPLAAVVHSDLVSDAVLLGHCSLTMHPE